MLLKIGHFIIPFTTYIRKFTKLTQQPIEFVFEIVRRNYNCSFEILKTNSIHRGNFKYQQYIL